jgi:hypothetical protein
VQLGNNYLTQLAVRHAPALLVHDLRNLDVIIEMQRTGCAGHSQAIGPTSFAAYTSSGSTPNALRVSSRQR